MDDDHGDVGRPQTNWLPDNVTPFKWASGTAADVADRIGTEMECRALHEDEEKGGGYPTAALERLGESQYPPFNPSFLAVNKDSN